MVRDSYGLNLIGPINTLGYGNVVSNILRCLVLRDISVSLFPIGPIDVQDEDTANAVRKALDNSSLYNPKFPSLRIFHPNDLSQHVGHSDKWGWPIFELDNLSKVERHQLNAMDGVIVCSQWAKDVVIKYTRHTDKSVHVIPLGVNTDIFKPSKTNLSGRNTVFLNVGKWEIRKGHDFLIKVFNDTFQATDNVELWLVPTNPFLSSQENMQWMHQVTTSKLSNKIKIIPRLKTQKDLARIMNQATCGVFPARAEGWNLELLEMVACGKPVAATYNSGQTEFLSADAVWILETSKSEPAYDGKWFYNTDKTKFNDLITNYGFWAKLDDDVAQQLSIYMRTMHNMRENNQHGIGFDINIKGLEVAKQYTWDNTVNILIETLSGVQYAI